MDVDPRFCLFVPGDRPDRFPKALQSGATAVILDLEDAVALDRKGGARNEVVRFLDRSPDGERVLVRVNGTRTPSFESDVEALRGRPLGGIVVPKADDASAIARLSDALGNVPVVAIVESARGLMACESVASIESVVALAFGPFDLAADLGGGSDWESMLPYRARVLVVARAWGLLAIDGPSLSVRDHAIVRAEATGAAAFGFDGKLLIHPDHVAVVKEAFRPDAEAVAHAERVLDAAARGLPAVVDGAMVDAVHVTAAERLIRRASSANEA